MKKLVLVILGLISTNLKADIWIHKPGTSLLEDTHVRELPGGDLIINHPDGGLPSVGLDDGHGGMFFLD